MKNIKTIYLFSVQILISYVAFAQWTWMNGTNAPNGAAIHGAVGMPSVNNSPQAMYAPVWWDDHKGNLWIYGCTSCIPYHTNELWKYNSNNNTWTFMGPASTMGQTGVTAVYGTMGVPSANNTPGGFLNDYPGANWVDKNGDLWMWSNALWKYSVASNQWTWMQGTPITMGAPAFYGTLNVPSPNNTPGYRSETNASWVDNAGNLWTFGSGTVGNVQEDIWMFDISLNQWVWKGGKNTRNLPPNYGTKGVSAATNSPGGRSPYGSWYDGNGNCYFFGGFGTNGYLSDLWKYNMQSNEFTWVSGTNSTADETGVFGTKCIPDVNNHPPSVFENRSTIIDRCGNFWMFGGGVTMGDVNTLWKYKPGTNEWTWVSGSKVENQPGVFGTKTVSAPTNMPPSLQGSVALFNKGIFIFGGINNTSTAQNNYNTVWRYAPKPIVKFTYQLSTASCGKYTFTDQSQAECGGDLQSWKWDFGDGTSSTLQNPEHQYSNPGTYNVKLIVKNCLDVTDSVVQTINATSSFSYTNQITNASCSVNNGSVTITPSGNGPFTYSWTPPVSTTNTASNLAAGTYVVEIKDASGCMVKDTVKIKSDSDLSLTLQSNTPANCGKAGTATVLANGTATPITYSWLPNGGSSATANLTAGSYTVVATDAKGCKDSLKLNIADIGIKITSQYTSTNISCNGKKNGSISINPTNGTAPYTYTWAPNVGNSNSLNNLPAGNYLITITDANGCTGTQNITLTQPPPITANIKANPASICPGEKATLEVLNASGGNGTLTFSWNPGNMSGSPVTVQPLTSSSYTCYISDANNCKDSLTTSITVKPAPVAAFSGGGKACADSSFKFTDLSSFSGGTITNWVWDFGDGTSSTSQHPIHNYQQAGVYNVSLTVEVAGCKNRINKPALVTIYSKPVAAFDLEYAAFGQVLFYDQSSGAQQWNWNFGDLTTSTIQHPVHTYDIELGDQSFTAYLTVTSLPGNCKDSIKKTVQVKEFTLYVPNAFSPNNDGNNDVFAPKGSGIKNFSLLIFNRWGELIYEENDTLLKGWNGLHLNNKSQEDAYVYVLTVNDFAGKEHRRSGVLHLIR